MPFFLPLPTCELEVCFMKTKTILAKVFAIVGSVLIWAPILFMLITAAIGSIYAKQLLFDYLMLAELFLVILAGVVLLFTASLLGHALSKWIGLCGAVIFIVLAGALLLAQITGLASGDVPATGWQFALVVGLIIVYNVLVAAIGVLGLMLIGKLYSKKPAPVEAPAV